MKRMKNDCDTRDVIPKMLFSCIGQGRDEYCVVYREGWRRDSTQLDMRSMAATANPMAPRLYLRCEENLHPGAWKYKTIMTRILHSSPNEKSPGYHTTKFKPQAILIYQNLSPCSP